MSSGGGDIRRRAGAVALDDEYGGLAVFVGWTKPPIPEMEEDRTTMPTEAAADLRIMSLRIM